jgi:fumarate reductase flavoprotein subunit
MAIAVGAAKTNLGGFYGHVLSKDAYHNDKLWPFPYLDPILQAGIIVSATGRRFADEGQGGTTVANAIARLDDPFSVTVIADDRIWNERGVTSPPPPYAPNPRLPASGGTMFIAPTLHELAQAARLPVVGLIDTVMTYNAAVHSGRTESLVPTRSSVKSSPMPIEVGPFYGFPAVAAISYTMDGIAVDGNGRVLEESDRPIVGLYAAGCVTGGLEGGRNVGYVNGLLKSGVTGLIAGETVLKAIGDLPSS